MGLFWILIAVVVVLLFLASVGRKQKQKDAVKAIRHHFEHIARLRLIAACPGLDGVLQEAELRLVFDWMLIELYRRTGASGLGDLMQWSLARGEAETARLTAEVAREAVDRLPRPVLTVIDACRGRTFAGVLLDESLTEAGRRVGPELTRSAR